MLISAEANFIHLFILPHLCLTSSLASPSCAECWALLRAALGTWGHSKHFKVTKQVLFSVFYDSGLETHYVLLTFQDLNW